MQADLFSWQPKFGDHFDGATFHKPRDGKRLNAQLSAVYRALSDGQWHTLAQLSEMTGAPEASCSARYRDLSKPKFGGFCTEKKFVARGLWMYRLVT